MQVVAEVSVPIQSNQNTPVGIRTTMGMVPLRCGTCVSIKTCKVAEMWKKYPGDKAVPDPRGVKQ